MSKVVLYEGDCFEKLKLLPDQSVDSIVTDPPYAISFMGRKWDYDLPSVELWTEVLRILKPGGHMLAFGGTRTYHRLVCAIEDAGFEIRDQIGWCFGQGFPKSLDVSKAIDKTGNRDTSWFPYWLRTERARIGMSQKTLAELGGFYDKINHGGIVANWELGYGLPSVTQFNKVCKLLGLNIEPMEEIKRRVIGQRKVNRGLAFTSEGPNTLDITAPSTDAAKQWNGWGSSLKPAWEPIVLARRSLIGTVVKNVLTHGTGAINIDACRIPSEGGKARENEASQDRRYTTNGSTNFAATPGPRGGAPAGRWPSNLIHDGSDEILALFPYTKSGKPGIMRKPVNTSAAFGAENRAAGTQMKGVGDEGSAARFYYAAKANSKDRAGSRHPTIKPLSLMRYLCRLVTPPGGTICDPFSGSGTTGQAAAEEGFDAILMEREPEYIEDIKRRCAPWMKKSPLWWSSRSAMNFPQRRNNLMETGHLAEITIKINVDETTDRDHIAQWLEMAMALDAPMAPIVTRSIAVGDESMSVTGPKAYVEQVMQTTDPAAAAHPDDQYDPDPDDETGEQQADEQQEASTGAGLPAPRRRGRRSNAEKAAEREAQERAAAAQPAAQQAAPRPAGAALPPGITMPGAQPAPSPLVQPNLTVAQGPAPTPVAPQEAAMPHVEPSPALGNGAIMALEDFREAVRELHQAKQGFPLLRMRAPTWMDGSAKPVWFTIESVPDIHRVKLIDDISNSMIAG